MPWFGLGPNSLGSTRAVTGAKLEPGAQPKSNAAPYGEAEPSLISGGEADAKASS